MKTVDHKTPPRKLIPNREHMLHFIKLVLRSLLFVAALAVYLIDKNLIRDNIYHIDMNPGGYLLLVIWVFFIIEMLFRFFPSNYESMGCQKQFGRNFIPNEKFPALTPAIKKKNLKSVVTVGASWIILNAVLGILFFSGVIDEAVLLIISMFFAVCDIVCILFYCPFQSLIMKNRCCVTCRIYNWDFLMMFTPLVFITSYYALSLVAIALLLFIRWEVTYFRHPEWFCEETNKRLGCAACTERLCIHKKKTV